jgi:hypothetical protein
MTIAGYKKAIAKLLKAYHKNLIGRVNLFLKRKKREVEKEVKKVK